MRAIRGRRIGAIFQDPLTSLHPLLRIGDQIAETILAHLDVTRAEARHRALKLLEEVGIPSPEVRIDHFPHQFSGGMRQRVVIVEKSGITHDMGVIAEPADRVAVMYAGRIVEVGTVADVIRSPRHPYTAGLMASIPSVHHRHETLKQIDGAMARLDAIPAGCALHPRCGQAVEACRQHQPAIGADSHAVTCHVPLKGAAYA